MSRWRLSVFDEYALVGASHRRAVDETMALVRRRSDARAEGSLGEGDPRFRLVLGESTPTAVHELKSHLVVFAAEPGGGKTRLLREIFEETCVVFDSVGAYVAELPAQTLDADRLGEAEPGFLWWAPDPHLANETELDRLIGVDLGQARAEAAGSRGRTQLVKALVDLTGVLGIGLAVADIVKTLSEASRVQWRAGSPDSGCCWGLMER